MRYHDIAAQSPLTPDPRMRAILEAVSTANAERLRPEIGWPRPAERAALCHEVECHGLTVHDLGQAFAGEFHRRKRWCREHCRSAFSVEPIRPEGGGRNRGRRFLFSDAADAAAFRRRWR